MTAVRIPRAPAATVVDCLMGRGAGAVIVRGPSTVGRTALVDEAAANAAAAGRRVLVTSGRALVGDLAAVVGVTASEPPSPADAAGLVVGLGRGHLDAVVVDDVHHADDRRAQIVHHLVTTVGVPVVLTAPDVARLPEPIEALRIADALLVVELAPLGSDELHALADSALGGQVASTAIQRLLEHSRGLPGEALDRIDEWRRDERLECRHGVWWLTDAPLDASARAALAQRGASRLHGGDALGALVDLREVATAPDAGPVPSDTGATVALLAEAELLAGLPPGPIVTATSGRGGHDDRDRRLTTVWVDASSRPREDAATLADGAATALAAAGAAPQAATAARVAWVLAPSADRADRFVDLAARGGSGRDAAVAALAAAVRGGDVAAVEVAIGSLELGGHLLDAALGADLAAGLHLAAGSLRPATAATARADSLLARCRVRRLLHQRPGSTPPPLSERELEIAGFVAEGWSNREIASRLHLSVRTVEGHVLRTCTKLGVPDRAGVAAALDGRDGRSRPDEHDRAPDPAPDRAPDTRR